MKFLKHIFTFVILLHIIPAAFTQTDKIHPSLSENNINKETKTVWIYFTDKGSNTSEKLSALETTLPERSRKRRLKNLPSAKIISFRDIPVNPDYLKKISPCIKKQRHSSRWLNALSAEVELNMLSALAKFAFVKKITPVLKSQKQRFLIAETDMLGKKNARFEHIHNYGASYAQNALINVPELHDAGYSGAGVLICMADAGFNNLNHPTFTRLDTLAAFDFVNNDENVGDEDDLGNGSHGTKTLSTIAGFDQGNLIGPAFGASYILVKTENTESETPVEEDNWIAAAEWAEYNYGPDIISTSLGYSQWYEYYDMDGDTPAISAAADSAAELGILVVNSAGNAGNGSTTISAPADGHRVLAVGAADSIGYRTHFSSVGPSADGRIKPDIMAMGASVTTAQAYNDLYETGGGTSYACPQVAGGAALLMEMFPEAPAQEIYRALKMTASRKYSPDNLYGYGIVNLPAAADYIRGPRITHTRLKDTENINGPYTVRAQIFSYTQFNDNSPALHYKTENSDWTETPMQKIDSFHYSSEIPAEGFPGEYQYYISAKNADSLHFLPANAPLKVFRFSAGPDTIPPTIIHREITEYYQYLWPQARLACTITDNSEIDPAGCYAEWTINGIPQNNLLFHEHKGVFYADFQNSDAQIGDLIEYRIIAKDSAQNSNTTYYPETGFQSFHIKNEIGFEANAFSHNWELLGDSHWDITNSGAQNSDYSAISGELQKGQVSDLSIITDLQKEQEVFFFKKTSDDSNSNYLRLYLDNKLLAQWNGTSNWTQESINLPSGKHTLKWSYQKYAETADKAFAQIDEIRFREANTEQTDISSDNEILIFPNPAENILCIKIADTTKRPKVTISDIKGRTVYSKSFSKETTIDISQLPRGFYTVKITNPIITSVKKLIIK